MRENYKLSWGQLRFWEKQKLYNKFVFVAIMGNICQILGTASYFLKFIKETEVAEVLVGFGCLFAWSGLSKYFMYS